LTCHLNDKSPLVTKLLVGSLQFVSLRLLRLQLQVGADGAMSTVRKAANMKQFSYSYNQVAVVATLQLSEVFTNGACIYSAYLILSVWHEMCLFYKFVCLSDDVLC
jgi:hypothetical protein